MGHDYILRELDQTEEKRQRFLAAWKRGVEFLGTHLFGPGTVEGAREVTELEPKRREIELAFAHESGGEEQFLSAMVSFYDPAWGAELAERIECEKSVCGLTYNLDHARIEILCELLRNYSGWPADNRSTC